MEDTREEAVDFARDLATFLVFSVAMTLWALLKTALDEAAGRLRALRAGSA